MAEFARGRVCRGRLCQGPTLSGAEFVRGRDAQYPRKQVTIVKFPQMSLLALFCRSATVVNIRLPLFAAL